MHRMLLFSRSVFFLWVSILGLHLALVGCVSIPAQVETAHNGAFLESCEKDLDGQPIEAASLDSRGFTLSSWNIYKGQLTGWQEDLERLYRQSDILLLQEAHLEPGLLKWLSGSMLDWSMAHAFTYRNYWTGVFTGAKVQQMAPCAQRHREPYLRLPKTVLISYFPLQGSQEPLLVINVHGVNFTLGARALGEQLDALERVLANHDGPVILAGDLNTWSVWRMRLVEELATRQGLKSVAFEQSPAIHLGQQVDHVYYRGLVPLKSRVIPVKSSDHYPLVVTFMSEQ